MHLGDTRLLRSTLQAGTGMTFACRPRRLREISGDCSSRGPHTAYGEPIDLQSSWMASAPLRLHSSTDSPSETHSEKSRTLPRPDFNAIAVLNLSHHRYGQVIGQLAGEVRTTQCKGLPAHSIAFVGQPFVLLHQAGALTQHCRRVKHPVNKVDLLR